MMKYTTIIENYKSLCKDIIFDIDFEHFSIITYYILFICKNIDHYSINIISISQFSIPIKFTYRF